MAALPSFRVNPSNHVFSECGLDFAGPFYTKQGRGKARHKRYLLLLVDLQVRAVHLEMTFGLDTDSFLNGFVRFAARRGWPRLCVSDNGSSFVSGDKEIQNLVKELDNERITANLANKGVKWMFNPPAAPHFGGVFETMIRSSKRAIKAVIGTADVTDEELLTVITGAESLLNSRPLIAPGSNVNEEPMLTPNHFMIGRLGGPVTPDSVDYTPFSLRSRWRFCQDLLKQYWVKWLDEIVKCLADRKKWSHERANMKAGDVVLLVDPSLPRRDW
ncbi:uncharacterized protein LOC141898989 [Tubulanus polymorphus]|uniref:uncharacterized protein LOC141898989 n=1 Tax=Tubulanus polymorphus TaxID=672921 RepID=UPI003DA65657